MNVPLIVAGSLALLAAAVHGLGGEMLVVRKLSLDVLPPTRLGGRGMTMRMIRVAWHMTTIAFVTVGVALVLAGSVLHGDAARGISVLAATAASGFAALALGSALVHGPRSLLRHPAPIGLTLVAVLAWWGIPD